MSVSKQLPQCDGDLSTFHASGDCTTTLSNAALVLEALEIDSVMPGKGKDESPGSCIAGIWNQNFPEGTG